jgi:threonine dehydratase
MENDNMTNEDLPGLPEIRQARQAIKEVIRKTPLVLSPSLTTACGQEVFLKLEHHQITGSFKLRGAANAVSRLSAADRMRGVVAASTGNHGRGLAYAARKAGVKCVICMSQLVPQNKIDGIRAEGADIRIIGRSQDDAQVEVDRLVADEGMTMLPPFDHADIIAGQGTLGLEILEECPNVTTVLVQLSGGGLISGVAAALKAQRPDIRVVGVSMERGAAMQASLAAGRPVEVEELPTLADSLGGGIGLENRYTFRMVRKLVDEVVLVSESEIAAAVHHAYWNERQIIEGSGSVGIAALLFGKVRPNGSVLALLSGGNIAMDLHHRLISGEVVDVS